MSMRSILCIAAVALGGSVVQASAGIILPGQGGTTGSGTSGSTSSGGSGTSNNTPTTPPTTPTFTRTFLFPAVGLAATESARIAAVNIAQTSHKGTAALCTGSISFTDALGKPVGAVSPFKDLPTGQIAHGDVSGFNPSNSSSVRNEYQGSVQVTVGPGASAPCSLLLTLEVFDTQTGVTRGLITSAIEEPLEVEPISAGRH